MSPTKIYQILLFGLILISSGTIFAQAPKKSFSEKLEGIRVSEKELTGNASTDNSSIGQGGNVSTSIPLITISSKSLSFSLQLNYASGITVDQKSGPVGLGWVLPVGSITRDYGAYEPDYTSTTGEFNMLNSYGNTLNDGWLNPSGSPINPSTHNEALGYSSTLDVPNMSMPLSDKYHLSIPGMGGNTFWNGGSIGTAHEWEWSEFERWRVESTKHTFEIEQEISRINEFNRVDCINCDDGTKNFFGTTGSVAGAIGVLPYVINGSAFAPTDLLNLSKVKYEDFNSFTITDDNGVVYVFGRPLRGQKFVFSDNPYWSTSSVLNSNQANSPDGNFWKIDFIAEWLLTEIYSPDYIDLNENGIADDEDAGDWIRFEYTETTQTVQTIPLGNGLSGSSAFLSSEVPKHREWSSFSQTDQASSLMRERAYLTRVITPLQEVDFTISKRMDIGHDFLDKPANKKGNTFYYENRKCSSSGTTGSVNDFDIKYPVETMKYDSIKVYSRLIDNNIYTLENTLTGAVVLKYADKGSPEELAVSDYTLRNNDNTPKLNNDGTHVGTPTPQTVVTERFSAEKCNFGDKRGKTTLLAVEFLGSDLSDADKTFYEFGYAYNPSYSEIHKREIIRKWTRPNLRKSGYEPAEENFKATSTIVDYSESIMDVDGVNYSDLTFPELHPSDFLIGVPYQEKRYKYDQLTLSNSDVDYFIEFGEEDPNTAPYNVLVEYETHLLSPVKDQYGFLYSENYQDAAKAWSLTSVKSPSGGIISYEYELTPYDASNDESYWSFDESEIPLIKQYNDLAKKRSLSQSMYNILADNMGAYVGVPFVDYEKNLTATIEMELPLFYGVRLKKKTLDDRVNIPVVLNYEYGTSHFSSLPSEFLVSHLSAYNSFLIREDQRHVWERDLYVNSMAVDASGATTGFINDFKKNMSRVGVSNLTLDDYRSTFFHEYIDTRHFDNSYSRDHYTTLSGDIYDAFENRYFIQAIRVAVGTSSDRFSIEGNPTSVKPIAMTKRELFDATETLAYQTETWEYEHHVIDSRELPFDYSAFCIGGNCYYVWNDLDGFENWIPIRAGALTPQALAGIIDIGPFSTPNALISGWVNVAGVQNGFSFVFNEDNMEHEYYTIHENPGMYLKWNTTKTVLVKNEANYKGLITTNETVYDPNDFRIVQQKVNGAYTEEKYITTYEYANETYGANNIFIQKNMLSVPTRVNKYLDLVPGSDPILPQYAISASATTYDLTSFSVPRALNTYQFETDVLNPTTGTFNLIGFDFNSSSNPNWRISQNDNIEYNKAGQLISTRANQLYSKTVFGNNVNIPKAFISNPIEAFDATYSGFEDFTGRHDIDDWNNQNYLDEDWFTSVIGTGEELGFSTSITDNPCDHQIPSSGLTTAESLSGHLNHVMIDNVLGLNVGDIVEIELTAGQYSVPSNFSWSNETKIVEILDRTDYIPDGVLPTWIDIQLKDYIVCFQDPLEFPESSYTINGVIIGGVVDPDDEGGAYTISETKINKKNPEYNLSRTYSRTGEYSYKLPTIKEANANPTKTAVRPVKLKSTPPSNSCIEFPPTSEETDECNFVYESSVWLKYDSDIASIGNGGGTGPKSADVQGDVTYQRGTVSQTDNQQGVKIICDVYNSDRTSLLFSEIFYVNDLNTDWKQYIVSLDIIRGNKWLDVYVQNERSQVGASIPDFKSVFVDDILIYPVGSKYSYSTYDKFGNKTFITNNNDVFAETVFDEKGRSILQKNVYGNIIAEQEYFENPNWANQVNHVTERKWVSNSAYNETRYYLDGFGKTKQTMIADHARNARIVSESNYFNDRGFPTASFKPYALVGSLFGDRYDTDYIFNVQDMYSSSNALTEVTYEAKPEMKTSTMSPPYENNETPIVASQQDYPNAIAITAPYGQNPSAQNYPIGSLLVHEVTDAAGNMTKTYLDNLGRVILEEHPIGADHIQNIDGTITMTTGNEIAQTWFVYDREGRIVLVVDPNGKQSTYKYNSLGVVIERALADNGTSELRYDKYGQIRFVRDQKDINSNAFGTDQFSFWKYDEWGRMINTGQKQAAPSTPSFTGQLYFDDYSKIDDQNFPQSTEPLVQIHQSFEFDGTRDQFDSDVLLCETVYHDHVYNADLTVTAQTLDSKCYDYMADGQIASVTYNYQGLDEQIISYTYNEVRIPTGRRYTHPTQSEYNFEWRTNLDNFARPTTNVSIRNGIETETGSYYYDVLGNLLVKGMGATGNNADPHLDYHFFKYDIRDQLTHNVSKHFRLGMKYDPVGNITDQFWSNEAFDPTDVDYAGGSTANMNQYHYYYDDLNRLIGADYRQADITEDPFAYFDDLFGNIPNDFLCGVNDIAVNEYLEPVLGEFEQNIEDGINVNQSTDALNGLKLLKVEYKQLDIAYSQMTEANEEFLLSNYLGKMDRARINSTAYELYMADQNGDTDHIDFVNDGQMSTSKMKYTQILMSGLPYNQTIQCDPNTNATVYGYLPTFPFPATLNNAYQYDAAYWYTKNGNITELNRNDDVGNKVEQDYSYSNPQNNQLSQVDWSGAAIASETHGYNYDANGNILTDSRNNVTDISYDNYDELPTSVTNNNVTRTYRYDASGQRIVKEIDLSERNYYIEGVVLNSLGEVIRYETPEGYVEVANSGGTIFGDYYYSVPDWLGSNRAILDATGTVLTARDHYPFGKKMRFSASPTEGERYQFTGHEFDEETGYGYHGARYYNRELGKYMNVDPLAEDYFSWSSYNYTMGNPINLIDPTGEGPTDWIKNKEGEYIWDPTVTDKSQVHEGQKYIGKEDKDIVLDLFGQTTFRKRIKQKSYFKVDGGPSGVLPYAAAFFTDFTVSIQANVTYNGDERKFNGIDFIANSSGYTTAPLNTFWNNVGFITTSVKFSSEDMKALPKCPNGSIKAGGPTPSGRAGSGSYKYSWSAKRVSNDFGKSYKRKISLVGQYTVGGVPIQVPNASGLVRGAMRTKISVTLPYSNN